MTNFKWKNEELRKRKLTYPKKNRLYTHGPKKKKYMDWISTKNLLQGIFLNLNRFLKEQFNRQEDFTKLMFARYTTIGVNISTTIMFGQTKSAYCEKNTFSILIYSFANMDR